MQFVKIVISKIKQILKVYCFVYKEITKSNYLLLCISLFSTLITGIMPIVTNYIIKVIVFKLENNVNLNNFIFIVGICALILFFKNIFNNFKEYVNFISVFEFTYCIQDKLIEKIKKIKYKTFYSPYFQNCYHMILQDTQSQSYNLLFTTIQMSALVVQLLITCVIIMNFNYTILIFLVVCTVPTMFLHMKNEIERMKVVEDSSLLHRKNSYNFGLFTSKVSMKEIKISKLEQLIMNNRRDNFCDFLKMWKSFYNRELLRKFYSEILPCLCMFVCILLVILDVINKKCSISDFVFISGIVISFKDLNDNLVYMLSRNYKCIAFANKLFDFLDANNEVKSGNEKLIVNDKHTIEFKSVYFKYPYSQEYALKDINFTISIGEKISLVGQNGCGKTTIINLILRLYDPTKGDILLDGINIKNYSYQEYLKIFSVVFQDYEQYSIKLTDYISSGDIANQENLSKMKQAAIMTTANSFVEKAPKNWESNLTTRFDKEGLELSGGQWQKLAVTRTFYSQSPILILDEPTSAMDAISESHIYESIKNIEKYKAVIFISHRMYSSKIATKIIYMENGEIKDVGTHDELIIKSDGYKKLFEEQANRINNS